MSISNQEFRTRELLLLSQCRKILLFQHLYNSDVIIASSFIFRFAFENISAGHKIHQEAQRARHIIRACRSDRCGCVVALVTLHLSSACHKVHQRTTRFCNLEWLLPLFRSVSSSKNWDLSRIHLPTHFHFIHTLPRGESLMLNQPLATGSSSPVKTSITVRVFVVDSFTIDSLAL